MAVNTAAMFARTRFGEELQAVRLATRVNGGKVKQIKVAQAMGHKSYHRYSRMERGETWPSDAEWKAIVKCLQMDLETRVRLETMRREGMSIGSAWWNAFEDDFVESLIEFVAYEDAASKITTCAANTVPGLLQTPEYGRTVTESLAARGMTEYMVERSVELRTNRRRIFDKSNPPTVEAIMAEAAFRQEVSGRDVMLRQLDSLIEDSSKRKVTYRVIPYTASATSMYTFSLFEFGGSDEKPVAAFDAMAEMLIRKETRDTRELRGYVESLRSLALSPLDSLEKLKTLRKEMSRA